MKSTRELDLTPDKRGRRSKIFAAVVVASALAGAWAFTFGGFSLGTAPVGLPLTQHPDPHPSSSTEDVAAKEQQEEPPPLEAAAPEPSPLGDKAESTAAVMQVMEVFVDAHNEVLQRSDGGVEGIETMATGFVQGEIEALALERAHQGYRQIGEAEIIEVTAASVDLEADPPTVELHVCVDSSGIDIVDSVGRSLKGLMYTPDHPVLHVYGAQYLDGRWKISNHQIPSDSSCAGTETEGRTS